MSHLPTSQYGEVQLVALRVDPKLSFICAAEREVIDRICELGFVYTTTQAFIQQHSSLAPSKSSSSSSPSLFSPPVSGLYVRALCNGLDELLDGYRAAILAAEQAVLRQPDRAMPLSRLKYMLRDYTVSGWVGVSCVCLLHV